ncbi:DMT family transporter [Candidatus Spongiihabitans sp.]|uniref:DMT family transporter n=1 Tax=Candidatus Spongiihabitans sp. TaxID=3101308 RepID=UPI003C6FDEB1
MESTTSNEENRICRINREKNLNNQKIGIFYLLISAVLFSFAGIFVKGVEASSWDVIYWRALFGVIFVVIWYGFRLQLGKQLRLRMSGFSIALLAVICTTAFLSSFKFTSIANVAMIYAVTPLMSGLLGWVILREHISKQELIASIFAIIGVAVVVNGSVGQINIYGDGLAIVMAVTLALIIVLFRKYPDTPSGGVNILSCAILVLMCSLIGTPFSVPFHEIAILAFFGLLFVTAYITLQEGAKILSPTLTALLSILETPLAPIWAWLILSEIPVLSTIVGGAIVLIAVLVATFQSSTQ